MGLFLDPWQQLIVRTALAERADGLYAAQEVAALVARQNGKGGALEAVVLDGLFLQQDPLTIWTAHQFKTTSEAFLRIKGWIEGSSDLSRKVKRIVSAHGEESIELTTGPRLRFIARSKSSGRGFSPQRVIWDEAQELSQAAVDALLPAMRAQRNKQSIYVGTVPSPDVNHPEHFTRLRDRGRARQGKRLAWLEWSPRGSEDPEKAARLDLADRKHWRAANPALGYRVDEESIAADYDAMSAEGFARETLSIWPTLPTDVIGVLDLKAWAEMADEKARKPRGGVVLFVDVAPDRSMASIGVAGQGRRGKTLLMARTSTGVSWVVPEVERLCSKRDVLEVCLHPSKQAGALLPEFAEAGIDVVKVSSQEMGQACSAFITGVLERRYTHAGQPELDAAVQVGQTRALDESVQWDRKGPAKATVSPLVAVSTAAYRYALTDADYDINDSVL